MKKGGKEKTGQEKRGRVNNPIPLYTKSEVKTWKTKTPEEEIS